MICWSSGCHREMEMLRLIVQVKSVQEIADALFLCYRTAGNRVTNILNKFGLDSRAAVATYAPRHHIVWITLISTEDGRSEWFVRHHARSWRESQSALAGCSS